MVDRRQQLADFDADKVRAYGLVFAILRDRVQDILSLARSRFQDGQEQFGDAWEGYVIPDEIEEELADALVYAVFGIWQARRKGEGGIIRFPKEARQ
jgi:hypothetical protein